MVDGARPTPEEILRTEVDAAGGVLVMPTQDFLRRFDGYVDKSSSAGAVEVIRECLLSQWLTMETAVSGGAVVEGSIAIRRLDAEPGERFASLPDEWAPPSEFRREDGSWDLRGVSRWTGSLRGRELDRAWAWLAAHSVGAVFRFGDWFSPDDDVAQWLIRLATFRNDIAILWRVRPGFMEQGYAGAVQSTRLIAAHVYEAATLCHKKYENSITVRAFVERLPQWAQDDFHAVRAIAAKGNAFGRQLAELRNGLYHYGYRTADWERLADAVARLADEETMWFTQGCSEDKHAFFADRVTAVLSGLDDEAVSVPEFMRHLTHARSALTELADAACQIWMLSHEWRVAEPADYETYAGRPIPADVMRPRGAR